MKMLSIFHVKYPITHTRFGTECQPVALFFRARQFDKSTFARDNREYSKRPALWNEDGQEL